MPPVRLPAVRPTTVRPPAVRVAALHLTTICPPAPHPPTVRANRDTHPAPPVSPHPQPDAERIDRPTHLEREQITRAPAGEYREVDGRCQGALRRRAGGRGGAQDGSGEERGMADDVVIVEAAVVDVERCVDEFGAAGAGGELGAQLAERTGKGEMDVLARVHRDGHAVEVRGWSEGRGGEGGGRAG
ncbi:hypothetical protein SAMN05216410_2580 [Sanguibacter gelidistatuariae]|uniref:Uncharacterized protein n=1 Tax=Sanguibacter gelidistatuariae TaxID=1814289 RepID=A0A1G6QM40_9MICO|nr:hypothetical protein [Sanguibacter gelidistatuariae]SDC93291.1 hypothetical protein SAMN05216410_2580 [Sanguibacter gelidistatuariae]